MESGKGNCETCKRLIQLSARDFDFYAELVEVDGKLQPVFKLTPENAVKFAKALVNCADLLIRTVKQAASGEEIRAGEREKDVSVCSEE
jgi:hypothetical protein